MSVILPDASGMVIRMEDGSTSYGPALMTNSGDNRTYTSANYPYSLCSEDENGLDRRALIRPDGLRNGCLVTPGAGGSADSLDIASGSLWLGGAIQFVSAVYGLILSRPPAGFVKKVSIVADVNGSVYPLYGTDGGAFSDTRGTAGGVPFIPAGEVELATVDLTETVGVLKDGEISFSPELSLLPGWDVDPYSGTVVFARPLPLVHTGPAPRKVYLTCSVPRMVELDPVTFDPPIAVHEFDLSTRSGGAASIRNGKAVVAAGGSIDDVLRRSSGSIRLFEFIPGPGAARKELFYAYVSSGYRYRAGEITACELDMVPVETPVSMPV